jgi:hypothetical protein
MRTKEPISSFDTMGMTEEKNAKPVYRLGVV